MGKVCHAIVDDMGSDNVFLGKNKRGKNIENNEEICQHSAYISLGLQGSINVRVALVCLNMAPNHKHFMCMCIYAFGRYAKGVC